MLAAEANSIQVTNTAILKIADILAEQNDPNVKLRVFVQGGGCSGFSYGFKLEEDPAEEDDFVIHKPGMIMLIDSMSMQYLQGSTVDYKETLMSNEFVIINPNAVSQCGCGSSFSV